MPLHPFIGAPVVRLFMLANSANHKQQIATKSALLHRQLQSLCAPIPARFLTGLTESDVQFD